MKYCQTEYVKYVVKDVPFLFFDSNTGTFDVADEISNPTEEVIGLLYKAVNRLRETPPPPHSVYSIRLDQIITGYYDRCLEYYCYERLNLGVPDDQTCWAKFAGKTHCLGRVGADIEFDDKAKTRFMDSLGMERRHDFTAMSIYRAYRKDPDLRHALKKDDEGWLMFCANIPIRPLGRKRRMEASIKAFVRKKLGYPRGKNILKIVRNIETQGWDNDLAKKPLGGVLGYSRALQRYQVITGKHRIAAVRYLYSQGKISGATIIEYPVISYPWTFWRQFRPHPDTQVCECCKEAACPDAGLK